MNSSSDTICEALAGGSRRMLAKAITLIESTNADDRVLAQSVLDTLPPPPKPTLRLGLTGTPGVGKSTFIELFGLMLCDQGHRVAVLAVDPSSTRSGGSILGDKTRMEKLARHPNAFIRPSPSATQLGGVARRSREVIQLVETAGFDIVLVETVGVGQSETMVAEMTDLFLLLIAPAGGDELQGVKRGIMEVADMVLVNKADGQLQDQAMRTCAEYAGALRLMRRRGRDPDGFPKAMTMSSIEGAGVEDVWASIRALATWRNEQGMRDQNRQHQILSWFHTEIQQGLSARLHQHPRSKELLETMEKALKSGEISAPAAANAYLDEILG